MKVKVIDMFRDIHTGELHQIGEALSISEQRFTEIESAGHYVEKIPEKPGKKAVK